MYVFFFESIWSVIIEVFICTLFYLARIHIASIFKYHDDDDPSLVYDSLAYLVKTLGNKIIKHRVFLNSILGKI